MRGNLANEDRSDLIRTTLETNGRVRITDLAQRLAVSEMTIRRDLERLESEGVARRVRGGAVVLGPTPFEERHMHQAHAKAKISHKLLALVPDRGAIGIDASSTLLRLATALDAARDLTVITNGLETFATLRDKAGITPLLTGGQVEPLTGSLVGPLACRSARDLLLERLFVSAAAVSPEFGASEASLAEAEVKRAMGSVAGAVVNDPQMTDVARRAAELVLEPAAVITGGWPPGMPADDFARYLELVPGAYAGLGVGTPGSAARPIIHNSDYLLDESGLSAGVAWFLSLVMNFDRLYSASATG